MTGRPNVGHATTRALVSLTLNGHTVHGRLVCIRGRRSHARCEIALPGGRRVMRPIDEVRLVPQPPAGALGPTP